MSAGKKYDIDPIDDVSVFIDRRGMEHKYFTTHGMKYSVPFTQSGFTPDPRKNIPRVQAMETRPDDIIICAFMKAGTHWLWEIVSMMMKGKAEYETRPKEELMLEFHDPSELDPEASPRIMNTHLLFQNLPEGIRSGKNGKIIFIQRNPKDVLVSQYHHLSKMDKMGYNYGSIHDFVDFKLKGEPSRVSWFDYTKSWEKAIEDNKNLPLYTMFYEDLKRNSSREIMNLANFLGIDCSVELADEISHKCSFAQLKHANSTVKVNPNPEMKEKSVEMYRKGEIGDWKNWLTVAENEAFDRLYEQEMKDSKFTFLFE